MRKLTILGLVLVAMALMTSCATQVDVSAVVEGKPAGFWSGLWHGIIAPFAFIGSFFSSSIAIFDVNNTGWWYELGFLLGMGGSGTGAVTTAKRGL